MAGGWDLGEVLEPSVQRIHPDGRGDGLVHVALFDEHHLTRRGVEQMLDELVFVRLTVSTGSVEVLRRTLAEQRVDLILFASGGTISAREAFIRVRPSGIPTLVVARTEAAGDLDQELRSQATGCLIGAEFGVADLASAIATVAGLSPALGTATPSPSAPQRASFARLLTPREQQVLDRLIEGLTNQSIATRLGMSLHAVKRAVALVMAKLGCTSRVAVAVYAVREGWLIRPPEPLLLLSPESEILNVEEEV